MSNWLLLHMNSLLFILLSGLCCPDTSLLPCQDFLPFWGSWGSRNTLFWGPFSLPSPVAGQRGSAPILLRGTGEVRTWHKGPCHTPCAAVGTLKGFQDENTVIWGEKYAPGFAWSCKWAGKKALVGRWRWDVVGCLCRGCQTVTGMVPSCWWASSP